MRSHESAPAVTKPVAAPSSAEVELVPTLSEQPSSWLMMAELLSDRGKPELARRAYLQALKLDARSEAAISGLLWLQISRDAEDSQTDRANRIALEKDLARFRSRAEESNQLWRAYAAGFLFIGKPQQALPWFARGWQQHPADLLWLADWAGALDATKQPNAARRLRQLALSSLSKPSANQDSVEDMQRRAVVEMLARMLRRKEPAAKLRDALSKDSLARLRGPEPVLVQATTEGESAKDSAQDSDDESDEDSDENSAAEDSADDSEDEDSADDSAETERASSDSSEATADVDLDTEESLASQRPRALTLGSDVHGLGGLLVVGGQGRFDWTFGHLDLGLRAGYAYLFDRDGRLATNDGELRRGEGDLSLFGRWRFSNAKLELGIGGNLRAEQSLAYGTLLGSYTFGWGLTLQSSLGINQVVEDTSGLRLLGSRDRLAVSVAFDLTSREFINGEANWHRYLSRGRERLSDGYSLYLEAGHRLRLDNPGWNIRLSGYFEENSLVQALPAGLLSHLMDATSAVSRFVIPKFAMVGAATSVRRGLPGLAPVGEHRLRGVADLWIGYLWPLNTLGYDLQLGLGMSLGRAGDLSLSGYVSNSRLGGGEDGLSFGAGLRYVY